MGADENEKDQMIELAVVPDLQDATSSTSTEDDFGPVATTKGTIAIDNDDSCSMDEVALNDTSDNEETKKQSPASGIPGACTNYVNSIVGAGVIGLPFALREAGFYIGVLLIVIVGMTSDYSTRLMVRLGVKFKRHNYEELCEHIFGRKGFVTIVGSMFLFGYGAMLAYLIIIGDTVMTVFGHWSDTEFSKTTRACAILAVSIGFILPLSLVKNMSRLARSSALSLVAVAWILFVIILRAATGPGDAPKPTTHRERELLFVDKNLFPAIGVISFAFVCHHNSFLVFNSLRNNTTKRWNKTTHTSIVIAIICSLVLSIGGYLTFRRLTEANLLNNYSPNDELINFTRLAYAITMILTYPMEIFVARHCINAIFFSGKAVTNRRHYIISLSLWASSVILACIIQDLGIVLEITGGVSATIIGFIMPASLHLRTTNYKVLIWRNAPEEKRAALRDLGPSMALLAFGILALVASTVSTITNASVGNE